VLREILGLAIIVLLMIGASRLSAEEPLPSQDEAIARAVENHPDIIAAKAKLALAESELNGKRMEISRQVLQAYSGLKNSEAQASAIKAKLDAVHHEFDALRRVLCQHLKLK
jgi:outer membrane protein TolC